MYNPAKPYKQKIIDEIKKTWESPYVAVSFDTYPLIYKKFKYPEVDHTDGMGTKGIYHWSAGTFRFAVLDALAMNLNDLAIVRAVPYKLSNHITVPKEDARVLCILREIAKECRKRNIAMVGGENSFHNNMEGMDISMTVSGFIKKPVFNQCKKGDVLIGFKSSGIHSNGFTLVRSIFGSEVRKEFTTPTVIYLDIILKLAETYTIHGAMHITGGAFTKLKDILGRNDAVIYKPRLLWPQKIFFDLYKKGIDSHRMYSTFNCGIGFIISVPRNEAQKIISKTRNTEIIGDVVAGSGLISLTSSFDGQNIIF